MEAIEADIGWDQQAPPNRRLRDPEQRDLELEDRRSLPIARCRPHGSNIRSPLGRPRRARRAATVGLEAQRDAPARGEGELGTPKPRASGFGTPLDHSVGLAASQDLAEHPGDLTLAWRLPVCVAPPAAMR